MQLGSSRHQVIRCWIARAQRRRADLQALAHRLDGANVAVSLSDISYDGCCLIAQESLNLGELLVLEVVDLGQAEAEVRWVEGKNAGVLFSEKVPASTRLRDVRRRQKK